MLRESATFTGEQVNLEGLSDPNCTTIDGVPHAEPLIRFSDAFLSGNADELAKARDALAEAMGVEAMVDAAGVASNFQRMDRIADGTGIPSDAPMVIMAEDIISQLKLDQFVSAGNTPKMSWLKRQIIKLLALPKLRQRIDELNSGA